MVGKLLQFRNSTEQSGAAGELAQQPGKARPSGDFDLGEWRVQPSLNRMLRGDRTVGLEPRICRLLVELAGRPGEVISRDELLETVWDDVVVGEEALTVAVSQLRRLLEDDARAPRYVETIRKGGYRLVAPVGPARPDPEQAPTDPPPDRRRLPILPVKPAVVVAVVAGVILGLAAWNLVAERRSAEAETPALVQGVPFTSFPGAEVQPALSPDGTRVAFVWDGESKNYDIYIKQRDTETPLRLTDHAASELYPAWSPDGSTIAFVRFDDTVTVNSVPAIGGPITRLCDAEPVVSGLDWSPDGRWLAFSAAPDPERPHLIVLLDLESLEVHRLTEPQAQFTCDSWPAFSPDGATIAFIRYAFGLRQDIFLVPTAGGEASRLTRHQRQIKGLDWTPDGAAILFAGAPNGRLGLWQVQVADQQLTWLPTTGNSVMHPSLAVAGQSLVYEELTVDTDIWRLELASESSPSEERIIDSTRMDYGGHLSPDGRSLAFVSDRSGSREVWVSDAGGGGPRRVTSFGGGYVWPPIWSPDGGHVACTASPEGLSRVYVVEISSGLTRRAGDPDGHEMFNTWSADGQMLYVSRDRGTYWEIWRMDRDGRNRSLVTASGQVAIAEERNGSGLIYLRRQDPSLWRLTFETEEEELLIGPELVCQWRDFALLGSEVFALRTTEQGQELTVCDLRTRERRALCPLPASRHSRLSVAPDGSAVLFDRTVSSERDLILVDGFVPGAAPGA